ncbi:hypothetical protein [Paraburkholderia azotifigens]|uniref:hypothetical protein n=1 Tax=Paraburkholderia azotifigens TaxID=2057004 RepID=UPI0038BBB827
MSIYSKEEAIVKAVDFAKTAIEAGWFKDVIPHGLSDHTNAGKEAAEFLGSFMKTLSEQIHGL